MDDAQKLFQQAVELFNKGRFDEAETNCLRVIDLAPEFAHAWDLRAAINGRRGHLELSAEFLNQAIQLQPLVAGFHFHLGITLSLLGKNREAKASLERTLALHAENAEAHFYLGNILKDQGSLHESSASFRRATELRQGFFEAHFNLGKLLQRMGKFAESVDRLQQAVRLKPENALAHYELGVSCQLLGFRAQAISCYTHALRLQPAWENALINLGNTLMEDGRFGDAINCLVRAAETLPESAQIQNNLGYAFRHARMLEKAVECFRRSIQLKPDAAAFNNLGIALSDQGMLDEAVTAFEQALRLKSDFAEAYCNLGNTLKEQAMLDDAIAAYRRALTLQPRWVEVHSNLLCTINPHAGFSAEAICEEHRRWDALHAKPLEKHIRPHANDRSLNRPLRIGYVSPDFMAVPVGRFMLPILESHDQSDCAVYCYASVKRPDNITESCRHHATVWRNVLGSSDEQLAQIIRQDKIDVLVDLTMHMIDHRLLAFARKPAPVQATYLAYCGTTGLGTMDYRLTDHYLDPPGHNEKCYTEVSVHLPDCYWCFRPISGTPDVLSRPHPSAGVVTFGCLNNFCKVTLPTLTAWSQVLQAVPQGRLVIHAQHGCHRDRVRRFFESQGILPDRIKFVPMLPGVEYFLRYREIDIALDTFPFCGGTTTCDALWMGVPVVTLAGPRAVNRSGLSLLSNIGLPELVAYNTVQYVSLATDLANDPARLRNLNTTLRERMHCSPLMDARKFTQNLEAAYRQMWIERLKTDGNG